jgi:hypothetical protein
MPIYLQRMKRWIALGAALLLASLVAAGEKPAEKIAGTGVVRSTGGKMALTVEQNNFRLRFFDEELQPMAPDVDRAVIRYEGAMRSVEQFPLARMAGEPPFLGSPRVVRGPFVFKVTLMLFRGPVGSDPVETYSFRYPGPALEPAK